MTNEEKCRHLTSVPDLFCAFCNLKTPKSLQDICLEFVSNNDYVLAKKNPKTAKLELKKGVSLPGEMWEKLLTSSSHINKRVNADFMNIFKDREKTTLKKVQLRGENINEDEIEVLLAHRLVELDITNCSFLRKSIAYLLLASKIIKSISEYGSSLETLAVNSNSRLFPLELFGQGRNFNSLGYISCIIDTPSLRSLVFRNMKFLQENFYKLLLAPMNNLTHLDLSSCSYLGEFKYSSHLTNLTSLVLYDIENMEDKISAICSLSNLKHLDISQSKEDFGNYINPNETLASIVKCLPYLTSLDISGTNLAGRGVAEEGMENSGSDIPGLFHRANNPLEFLGLYHTSHNACSRHNIPARLISGHANEEQLLLSALAFYDRPAMLQKILYDILILFRKRKCEYVGQVLNIVLEAMEMHISEKEIQLAGISILFYIVRCRKSEVEKTVRTREKIFLALINAMVAHFDDEDIKTNSYYTFINFNMRQDIINRVVDARVNSERRIFLTRIKSLFPNLMNSWR